MTTSRVVGIDLGTTNSCVAVMDGDQPLVMTGPVLHRSVAPAPAALSVVSRRCYLVSLGVGFLVELDGNERALHDGAPGLASLWQPSEVEPSHACERAFGAQFRLPTSSEAEAWLARQFDDRPLFVQDAGKRRGRYRRRGQRRSGPEAGGVYDIDCNVRLIGEVNHALRLPIERAGDNESLREKHYCFFALISTLRRADRRERGQNRSRLLQAQLRAQQRELVQRPIRYHRLNSIRSLGRRIRPRR